MCACDSCPYNENGTGGWNCRQMHKDALELLNEQQKGVTPKPQNSGGWIETKQLWYCGSCHARVSKRKSNFCQCCGRKVKWE